MLGVEVLDFLAEFLHSFFDLLKTSGEIGIHQPIEAGLLFLLLRHCLLLSDSHDPSLWKTSAAWPGANRWTRRAARPLALLLLCFTAGSLGKSQSLQIFLVHGTVSAWTCLLRNKLLGDLSVRDAACVVYLGLFDPVLNLIRRYVSRQRIILVVVLLHPSFQVLSRQFLGGMLPSQRFLHYLGQLRIFFYYPLVFRAKHRGCPRYLY